MRMSAFCSTIWLAAAVAIGIGATSPALAQGTGTIRGTVTDAATRRPLAGVQVAIPGTRVGAVTPASGEFVISNAPSGSQTVTMRRIGFAPASRTVNVPVGSEVRLDVALAESVTQLDQIVVTGTAAPAARRTVGNAITTLDASALTAVSSLANVTDLLQSKSPGVTLTPGSGTAGTAADIRIRGTSSLSGSNRPIFYIDGVRFYDGQGGNFGPSGAGDGTFSQGVSALDAINPQDIESIEVIKGPAAATLYGADAAGGVIQIITKKGNRGSQGTQWMARAEGGQSEWALTIPDNYTTCTQARIDAKITGTGPTAGTPAWPGCQGIAVGNVITGNPLRDDPEALRTGGYRNMSLSARGGGDRYDFFLSGDYGLDEGVLLNNFAERMSSRVNFNYSASDRLDFSVNSSYIRARQRLPLGDDAGGGVVISATRGQPGAAANDGRGWRINLPETSNEYDNRLETDRYVMGFTVNNRPASWFSHRATVGLDYNSPLATIFYEPYTRFSSGDFPSGYLAQRTPQTRLMSFDYNGSVHATMPWAGVTSDFSFGAQGTRVRTRTLAASASGIPSRNFRLIQNATTVGATSAFSEQASLGYYAQEQLGFGNRLFLTGAVRADDNSAFGEKFDRVYYPKGSISYVVSEEPAVAGFFDAIHADDFKLRAAYGQAGRSPGPYDALRTYTSSRVVNGNGSVASGIVPAAPGNENLKPERGTEMELGFDASFLDNRLGAEFTYYDKRTSDALISIGNAPSLGYTGTRFINFAELRNSGFEIALNGTPVQARNFVWDATLTYATNDNELQTLSLPGLQQIIPYNPYAPSIYPTQIIREKYPIAGFWGVDVKRTADGSYDLSPTGALQFGELQYVGPALPTYEGGFSNTLTFFRDFRLYALIDFKGGNYLFNQRDRNRDQASNRNSERFNDPNHPLTTPDSSYWSGNATMPWIQPADFIKLRDLSLSYTVPPHLARALRSQSLTLTVAGHNLGFISKKYDGIDPEVNFFGQSTFRTYSSFAQFIRTDSYTLPMVRRITASVTASF